MNRIVIVGALGYLGSSLRDGLSARGHRVAGVARRAGAGVDAVCTLGVGDDGDALSRILEAGDLVVNLAGLGTKDTSDATALAVGNLAIARDVGLACARRGVRLLHVSSADVHPIATRAGALETTDVVPDTAYGIAKLLGELQLSSLCDAFAVLRPTYVVGKGLPPQRLFAAILAQLAARPAPSAVTLHGDPDARIDYLAMSDFVSAVEVIAQRASFNGERYQAASGTLTSTRDAATWMVRAAKQDVAVVFAPAAVAGDRDGMEKLHAAGRDSRRASGGVAERQQGTVSTRSLAALGWSASTSLADALRFLAEVS